MKSRHLLALAPLALMAGCAYTPEEVEQRHTNGLAMAEGSHDQILADTNANYAHELAYTQEWNMTSIFGLPAYAAIWLMIGALVGLLAVLIIGIYWRAQVRIERSAYEARIAQSRETQLTERKKLELEVAKALREAHACPSCSATPSEQLRAQKIIDAAQAGA